MDRDLQRVYGRMTRFLKDNSSLILSCLAAGGTVTTTVLAVKATPKALYLLEEAEKEKGEKLTTLEKAVTAAPAYIPAAVIGASTIVCIFSTHVLNQNQQSALTSAYMLLENSYKDYRNKVKELYGEDADNEIHCAIAKDKYEDVSEEDLELGETTLYYDDFANRFFEKRQIEVAWAAYELNRLFILRGYATLNDFYRLLDVPEIEGCDEVGWDGYIGASMYGYQWIDFYETRQTMDDGIECIVLTMPFAPTKDCIDEWT